MKKIILVILILVSLFGISACVDQPIDMPNPTDVIIEATTLEKVQAKMDTMNLSEKVAQMVQAERGSITPEQVRTSGIGSVLSGGGSHPSAYNNTADQWYQMVTDYQEAALESSSGIPIIYGIDAVHGNNNLYGATIFPHNIGLGAANDVTLTYRIGKATAEEMLVTGITWTFAPALSVVEDISWGRTYEGLSENPLIHLNLTESMIRGLEDNGVSATAKHYLGDGGTDGGVDQGNVIKSEAEIRDLYLTPYIEAIEAGVDTIMISFSSIDGIKMHGSHYWITEVLKDELGFEGFIISDWNAIHQLPGSYSDQIIASVNAGVDMLMEPTDWLTAIDLLHNAVLDSRISIDRINDAVKRILMVKYDSGLMENPLKQLSPEDYLYNQEHQDLAREAVRKSLVLLKNDDDALPLEKNETVYVIGPAANHVGYMSGGWTTYWQGNTASDIGVGIGIRDAFSHVLGTTLVDSINAASTVVVVLTEIPYSEGVGDNDILSLTAGTAHPDNLAALSVAEQAHQQGKKVIGILISGRPLILENYLSRFDAFVAAWLPGSEGGNGIADVLFGDYDFTGKLSYTWPKNQSQIGYNSNLNDYDSAIVEFPFGYGLKYSD